MTKSQYLYGALAFGVTHPTGVTRYRRVSTARKLSVVETQPSWNKLTEH
ncbi:hypothetical protein NIES25_42090 [Nostoc linckia NIES-25]|nr:hypothetical protein NIES25_42090 [Nostoc linckia NIES-25]